MADMYGGFYTPKVQTLNAAYYARVDVVFSSHLVAPRDLLDSCVGVSPQSQIRACHVEWGFYAFCSESHVNIHLCVLR